MTIFMYPSDFKIKSKADASRFLNMRDEKGFGASSGEVYWCDDTYDYCLYIEDANVGHRLKSERGNIFSPYFVDPKESLSTIWRTRKHINAKWFTDDK